MPMGVDPRQSIEELRKLPFPCVNCSSPIRDAKVYCSQACAQEAGWVRYARRCRVDGRDKRADVVQALQIRLALILAGGYDKLARKLHDDIRTAVIQREHGKCRICGDVGSEIDHISGDSNDPENLQLLCDSCHNKKTIASFVRITKESHPDAWEKAHWLKRRATAITPLQVCDSENWSLLERDLLRRRRELLTDLGMKGR
jgi:5-methylcytosine-specific restriction endonuclease McrA